VSNPAGRDDRFWRHAQRAWFLRLGSQWKRCEKPPCTDTELLLEGSTRKAFHTTHQVAASDFSKKTGKVERYWLKPPFCRHAGITFLSFFFFFFSFSFFSFFFFFFFFVFFYFSSFFFFSEKG